jgi:molecular chaperone GrpE
MPNIPDEHVSSSEGVVADTPDLTQRVGAASPQAGEEPQLRTNALDETPQRVASCVERPPSDFQTQILLELKALGEEFALKLKYDQAKEKAIDALHDELRQHRGGLHFTLLRPLLSDLISLHDDLLQLAAARTAADAATARTFEGLASSIKEILARQGVATLEIGSTLFDGKRQRAIRTVATEQNALVGCVAERIRTGFVYDDRVVRPEHVALYVADPTAEPTESGPRQD